MRPWAKVFIDKGRSPFFLLVVVVVVVVLVIIVVVVVVLTTMATTMSFVLSSLVVGLMKITIVRPPVQIRDGESLARVLSLRELGEGGEEEDAGDLEASTGVEDVVTAGDPLRPTAAGGWQTFVHLFVVQLIVMIG